MQVLIVDDDEFALDVLQGTLARMGHSAVPARDGAEALKILRGGSIRVVITDWDMPGMNGLDLCRTIRREDLPNYVYIVMLTGREGAKQRLEGLCSGADDFLTKPLDPEEMIVGLKTAERILSLETRDLALFALAKLAESRDRETGPHVERMQGYARLIAKHLSSEVKALHGVDEEYIRILHQTSPLHDLGKVSIPDSILLKPGPLTRDEFEVMKSHTVVAGKTLGAALERFPQTRYLQIAREIALTHHERFDGNGYPYGLAGEQIPLCGRIVAVADVYDAMTSQRIYRRAVPHDDAKAFLIQEQGGQFDPECVQAFLRAEEQILTFRRTIEAGEKSWAAPTASLSPTVARASELASPPKTLPASLATPEAVTAGAVPFPDPVLPVMPPSSAIGQRSKLLIVEDNPILLTRLKDLLGKTGETVFAAANGDEALQIWQEHRPQVIVSDWELPGMNGLSLCRSIRSEGCALTHFIMLTAHSDKERLLEAYEAGIDDFLSKPFDFQELLARVRAGIRTAKLHAELLRKATGSQARNAELATANGQLERMSLTDELTGLFNRRYAMRRLEECWTIDWHGALSVAMLDIDHFKKINDTYGHPAGDHILREVGGILRRETRATDVVTRVGGEEFLLILPSQTLQECIVCIERCRAAVANHRFEIGQQTVSVTISIGGATRLPQMKQFSQLLEAADEMLYLAKRSGRNCVRTPQSIDAVAKPAATGAGVFPRSTAPTLNWQTVVQRCGGDEAFAIAIKNKFCAKAPEEIARMQVQFNARDTKALARNAHSLKSMAAYVSADGAAELSRQIESLGHRDELNQIEPLLAKLKSDIDEVITWLNTVNAAPLRCA